MKKKQFIELVKKHPKTVTGLQVKFVSKAQRWWIYLTKAKLSDGSPDAMQQIEKLLTDEEMHAKKDLYCKWFIEAIHGALTREELCKKFIKDLRIEKQKGNDGSRYYLVRRLGAYMWFSCGDTRAKAWREARDRIVAGLWQGREVTREQIQNFELPAKY